MNRRGLPNPRTYSLSIEIEAVDPQIASLARAKTADAVLAVKANVLDAERKAEGIARGLHRIFGRPLCVGCGSTREDSQGGGRQGKPAPYPQQPYSPQLFVSLDPGVLGWLSAIPGQPSSL